MISTLFIADGTLNIAKISLGHLASQTLPTDEVVIYDMVNINSNKSVLQPLVDKKIPFHIVNSPFILNLPSIYNLLINNSRHPLITFMHSNDNWFKNKLDKQISYLNKSEHLVLSYSDFQVSNKGKVQDIYCPSYDSRLLIQQNIISPSFLLKRKAITSSKPLLETADINEAMHRFLFDIAHRGMFTHIPEPLYCKIL